MHITEKISCTVSSYRKKTRHVLLTEADDGRQIRELRVTDPLRDGQAGNCKARDHIRLEELEGVLRPPLKDWEEVLKGQDELPKGSLVLELVKGVIREEDLTKPLLESLDGGPVLWQANLVDLQRWRMGEGGLKV